MRKYLVCCALFFAALALQMPFTKLEAQCVHSTHATKNNFFPSVRFVVTPVFVSANSAISFLGEVGPRNWRANGTIGWIPCEQHRFKLSFENLSQRLKYNFSSGETHRWLHQFATGGEYQYWFDCSKWGVRGLDFAAQYSRAPSKRVGSFSCPGGVFSVLRRIAGSWYVNGSVGAILQPWECGNLVVALDWSEVKYDREFHRKKRVSGLGGSFDWTQVICSNFILNLRGDFQRAFNAIEGGLRWNSRLCNGDLSVGVYGGHLFGKDRLPSSSTAGLELRYSFGVDHCSLVDPRGCCEPCLLDPCDIAAWVAEPAVYMPQVLAISEERSSCILPGVTTIPNQTENEGPYTINAGVFFSGPGLTFSAAGLPVDATINPATGVITGFNPGNTTNDFTVTVTATNTCGSATGTFTLTELGGG